MVDCEHRPAPPGRQRQLERRIPAQAVDVGAVLVAVRDHEQAEADDLRQSMNDPSGRPGIFQARRKPVGDPQRFSISRRPSTPALEDSRPASKQATTGLPATGDRPGSDGVSSSRAGMAVRIRWGWCQQLNPELN